MAIAPKPDAELAIPELCGKVFSVSMTKLPCKIQGRYFSMLLKYFSIFSENLVSSFPAKKVLTENFSPDLKIILVSVLQLLSVKLMLGFAGICPSYFPQYLIRAILLGQLAKTSISFVKNSLFPKNCCGIMIIFYLTKVVI